MDMAESYMKRNRESDGEAPPPPNPPQSPPTLYLYTTPGWLDLTWVWVHGIESSNCFHAFAGAEVYEVDSFYILCK